MKIIRVIELEEQDFIEGNKAGKLQGWNNPVNAAMYFRGMLRSVCESLNEERSELRNAIPLVQQLISCRRSKALFTDPPTNQELQANEWLARQSARGVPMYPDYANTELTKAKEIIRRLLLWINDADYVGGLPDYHEARKFLGLE